MQDVVCTARIDSETTAHAVSATARKIYEPKPRSTESSPGSRLSNETFITFSWQQCSVIFLRLFIAGPQPKNYQHPDEQPDIVIRHRRPHSADHGTLRSVGGVITDGVPSVYFARRRMSPNAPTTPGVSPVS
jgi:hypothetical protein